MTSHHGVQGLQERRLQLQLQGGCGFQVQPLLQPLRQLRPPLCPAPREFSRLLQRLQGCRQERQERQEVAGR